MRHIYGVDIFGTISEKLSSLSGFTAMAKELVQNADDEDSEYITFDFCEDGLYVSNGSVFDTDDFANISNIASRGKEADARKTGAFGIGFVSVYQITDRPELQSAGKKYVFYPAEKAVDELDSEIKDHTEFFLPWAFDPESVVRTQLKRQAIEKSSIQKYIDELISEAPDVLLFLRTLNKLKVSEQGLVRTEFICDNENPPIRQVTKIHDGKPTIVRKWLTYEDSFDALGTPQLNKEPTIGIAFPVFPRNTEDDGILYNFLPTGLYTGYKFHINGDFFPTPDRKNIVIDGDVTKVAWNDKVVDEIGKLLIKCVVDLKQRLNIEDLYQFFPAQDFKNKNLPSLEAIRNIFYTSATREEIVPDNLNKWYRPENIYLLNIRDDAVKQSLEDIGIPIVNINLRRHWPILQTGLGVKILDISTLVRYIRQIGIKSGTLRADAPEPFSSIEGQSNILLFVQDRLNSPGEEKQLDYFGQLSICPDREGRLSQYTELKMMTPSIEKILPQSQEIRLIDAPLQAQCKEILTLLCSEYSWRDLIDLFATKTPQEIAQMDSTNSIDLMELYDYLADHEQSILKDNEYCDKLINSCIFMTNKQFKPLAGLSLSGNYKDPIGLDIIIDDTILSDKARGFLRKLGVKSLDFLTYVTKYAPVYFHAEYLWREEDKRLELTEEIRKNFSLISDNREARNLLKTLIMIPCNDNEFHAPNEIYIKSELLDIVLPNIYYYPDDQRLENNLDEWVEWLRLLDVTNRPKPEDVIRRTRELAAEQSLENIRSIEKLFYYYCDIFYQDDFKDEKLYEQLKHIEWIPVEDDNERYYLPSEAFLPFSKYLFYSQVKFVTFNQMARMRGNFLRFIDIGNYPPLDLVVKHLLWLAGTGNTPNYNIYRVLNEQFDEIPEDAVTTLRDGNYVFIEGKGYYKAKDCYWGNHPFGDYRQKVSDQIKSYYKLLKGTGVNDEPHLDDYLEVIVDISEIFGNTNKPVDDETRKIINTIYTFLSQNIAEISDISFDELQSKKVVLDKSGLLRLAGHIFFEDKGIKVDIFRDLLKNELVDKESDTWQFLEKLGVRHLSKAIQPIDFQPSPDREPSYEDITLVKNRKSGIMTIIETQRKDFNDGWDLVSLESLEIYEATSLSVKYTVQVDSRNINSDNRLERSFYDKGLNRLYVSRDCVGDDRTYEIARNLAEILNPLIDPCHILPVLVEVLNPSQEPTEIDRYLQRMGYDIVIESREKPYSGDGTNGSVAPKELDITSENMGEEERYHPSTDGQAETLPSEEGEIGTPGSDKPMVKKARKMPGLNDEPADKIQEKRRAWLLERLEQERKEQSDKDSEYTQVSHQITPEERETHKRFALIFYNRQIEDLLSRVKEIESTDSPSQYSIYGAEWVEISTLIRKRDGDQCRRCGLTEEEGSSLVVHHICPRKEGGSNWPSNLITLCRTCHAEVEDRPWLL